ncbi:aminotransferase-like domain-containing protein [Paeniglutamicibacter sulfureus]|uniref:2-aminoadipate transaminase n=1 Tax=Paeniglutamicibacter sulfureus TaxID=43666 RepID=A0ABU2BHR2_9MICC|nr:PLP-dependent aminotransferase family protein [Paeniglutamicibacter sulfureus]MDR7358186.1 2-aminoadipate transaminase [Paeniglutamicibacter sulfureus]
MSIEPLLKSPTSRLASRVSLLKGSIIDSSTSLLASQKHDIIRFAMGAPNAELIPEAEFARLATYPAAGRYDYAATEGNPELIEQIVAYHSRRGVDLDPSRLLVTTGGMQGLDIAFKLFVDPSDLVIVESPTYTNGIATALSYQGRVLEAPVDEQGLIVEALPALVAATGQIPKVIYTIPNFQNPSGRTLSGARRMQLLELAEEWDAFIIDDDPYGLLRFEGSEEPSFAELSPGNPRVVSVRTFSKVLAPGLRVGWMDMDPALRALAVNAKQSMDTCTNGPMQQLIADYLSEGRLDAHLNTLREVYRERKQAMLAALAEAFGQDVEATDPEGGFFLWLTLRGRYAAIHSEKLFPIALAHGVAYIPGPAFSDSGAFADALRLCFATSTPARIAEGVQRLHAALEEALASGDAR